MYTTPNMSLIAWDLDSDPYDNTELVTNWSAIDSHNHTAGKGAPLLRSSIPVLGQEHLEPCSVNTIQLCDNSITSPKLQSNSVSRPKIQDGAINSDKLADGSATEPKIGTAAVTSSKIGSKSVTETKIGDAAVTNSKVKDSAINNDKLSTNSVSNIKVKDRAIGNSKLDDDAVSNSKLVDGAISNPKIQNNTIQPSKFTPVPSVGMIRNQPQGIGNQTNQVIWFNQFMYDTAPSLGLPSMGTSGFTDRIYIRYSGLYHITGGVRWYDPNNIAGKRLARIKHNGFRYLAGQGPHAASNDHPSMNLIQNMACTTWCQNGDYIQVEVYQNSGTATEVWQGHQVTHISAALISRI